jgi:arylsulfatase A-like enzyme
MFILLFATLSLWAAPPNVVLILTDNQSYFELGCHGHDTVKTPNIDALAKQSIDFTNFHAPPYCSPSRGLLMTGRYALRHGIHNTIGGVSILHKDEVTIADHLSAAGYATGIFGKWHLGTSYPYSPEHRGFQETFVHGGGGIGQLEDYFGNDHLDATYWHNGQPVKSKGFSSDVLFDHGRKFIEKNKGKPFFCFISTPATHKPWQAHPQVADRIKARDGDVNLPLNSMIENIDDNVGKVLEQLDQLKLTNNTLVIVATDQGMRARGKPANAPLPPGVAPADDRHHVFCMMRYPPLTTTPGANTALTAMADVPATILDLCGLKLPEGLDGRSLRPLLTGAKRWADDRELIIQCPRSRTRSKWKNAALKTQRWRLVADRLYDVEGDAKTNVADQFPEVVSRLNNSYDNFWNSLPDEKVILSRHPVGSPEVAETRLNCMDWYQGASPWNRGAFRGHHKGIWAVEVVRDGRYRFELRRFPREANQPIGASKATVKIGGASASIDLAANALHATIELQLKKGVYDLETTFSGGKKPSSAYFAYVSIVE